MQKNAIRFISASSRCAWRPKNRPVIRLAIGAGMMYHSSKVQVYCGTKVSIILGKIICEEVEHMPGRDLVVDAGIDLCPGRFFVSA